MKAEQLVSLYKKYCNQIYRLALSYTCSPQDAEDIVQSVFLKLYEKNPSLDKEKEKAWLTQVTLNCCKDLLKSHWRRNRKDFDSISESQLMYMTEEESELFLAVMNLPLKYRSVVHLHYYEGYSFKEISKFLKISTSAVSMRLHRSRELLREQLKEE